MGPQRAVERLSQKAAKTALGAGSTRLASSPLCAAISHARRRTRGSAQDASVRSAADRPERSRVRTAVVMRSPPPDAARWRRLAERPGVDPERRAVRGVRQRQQREHQLGEAVGFLEVRVAGEDEGVDAERRVLLACARRPVSGRRPAPCRRRRAPGRRRPTGWARPRACRGGRRAARSCGAGRPNPSARRSPAPRRWSRRRAGDQPVGGRPGLVLGLAHDDVQADAEAAACGRACAAARAHVGDLLGHRRPAARPRSGRCRPARPRARARPPTSRRSRAAG